MINRKKKNGFFFFLRRNMIDRVSLSRSIFDLTEKCREQKKNCVVFVKSAVYVRYYGFEFHLHCLQFVTINLMQKLLVKGGIVFGSGFRYIFIFILWFSHMNFSTKTRRFVIHHQLRIDKSYLKFGYIENQRVTI